METHSTDELFSRTLKILDNVVENQREIQRVSGTMDKTDSNPLTLPQDPDIIAGDLDELRGDLDDGRHDG